MNKGEEMQGSYLLKLSKQKVIIGAALLFLILLTFLPFE